MVHLHVLQIIKKYIYLMTANTIASFFASASLQAPFIAHLQPEMPYFQLWLGAAASLTHTYLLSKLSSAILCVGRRASRGWQQQQSRHVWTVHWQVYITRCAQTRWWSGCCSRVLEHKHEIFPPLFIFQTRAWREPQWKVRKYALLLVRITWLTPFSATNRSLYSKLLGCV